MPNTGDPTDPLKIDFQSLILHRLKFAVQEYFSPSVLQTMKVESWQDEILDRMAYRMTMEIYGEILHEEVTPVVFRKDVHFSYPANWWNHLKDQWNDWWCRSRPRWFPIGIGLWFVRPVKMKTVVKSVGETRKVKTQQFAVFPMHNIATPNDVSGLEVIRYERVVPR